MKNVLFAFIAIYSSLSFTQDKLPELKIKLIAKNVYQHTSYQIYDGFGLVASHGLIFIDDGQAYLIDTPSSLKDTKSLVHWISQQDYSVKASVSTHFHTDSTTGISLLNSLEIPTYAYYLTNDLLKELGQSAASRTIKEARFWLVKDKLEIFYPGPGHTKDYVVVWLPQQKILFGGCFVKPKSLGNISDAVLSEWPQSVTNLMEQYGHAKRVVPGHGKSGDITLLMKTKNMVLKALSKSVKSQPSN